MSRDDFQQRVSRVTAGHDDGRTKKKRSVLPPWYERLAYPLTFVGAFVLGYATIVATRIVRGQYLTDAPVTDVAIAMDAVLAIIIGMTIRVIMSIKDPLYIPANTMGTLAGIMTLHNFVWWWPEASEFVFGGKMVERILTTTEPNSIMFQGMVIAAGQS